MKNLISHRVTENTEKNGVSFLKLCALCGSVAKMKLKSWLPDMDLNHDKQIQSLLCYRYTIGQDGSK